MGIGVVITKGCLLVVGNRAIADQVKVVLQDIPWTIRVAESVQQAVNIGTYDRIDALVVVMRLPDGRGDTVFWYLAAAYPHLHSHTLFLLHDSSESTICSITKCPWLALPLTTTALQEALHTWVVPAKK
jgi:hypothetical protein